MVVPAKFRRMGGLQIHQEITGSQKELESVSLQTYFPKEKKKNLHQISKLDQNEIYSSLSIADKARRTKRRMWRFGLYRRNKLETKI